MPEEKKPKKIEGMAERALRELGLGGLVDFALRLPLFKERFEEVDRQIEESGWAKGERVPRMRFSVRPHVESRYSVRYIREGKGEEWAPAARKPVQRIVARRWRRWSHWSTSLMKGKTCEWWLSSRESRSET